MPGFWYLSLNVRQEPHKARALHGLREKFLMLCREPGLLSGHKTGMGIKKLPQNLDIFVIDVADIIARKEVALFR